MKISELGFQDEVIIQGLDVDDGKIRGFFYQETRRTGVYGDQLLFTYIAYSTRQPVPWQRLVCAKELVHIFDGPEQKTDSEDEVLGLIDKLVGPFSSDDASIAELLALTDKIAVYQCLPLVFPNAARETCRKLLAEERVTLEKIADRACIPLQYCQVVLSDDWPRLLENLIDC